MAYQAVNPANNQLIKTYPAHSGADMEAALQQADALYHSAWAKSDIGPRLEVLHKLADLIDSQTEELAKVANQEMGKLIKQNRDEVKLCTRIARYYADNAKSLLTPVGYPSELDDAWVEHRPIGVLMAVKPWNFPYYQLMCVLAPNLAAGSPVIVKHVSIVPHCMRTFARLARKTGASEGAWTNLFISQEQVVKIIADDRVQGVALTGSEEAGSVVAAQATKHIRKSTLGLGGDDVLVVLDGADLGRVVKIGVQTRLNSAGRVCTAAKRFILRGNIAESLLAKFSEAFRQVKIDDPLDESTMLGPLSSKDVLDVLGEQVDEAVKNGATLRPDGKTVAWKGSFFESTILTGITRDSPAYFEEFFGPVVQIYVMKNGKETIQLANDSRYGLGDAVFSQDVERARRMASTIKTGVVYINWPTDTTPELPFGGMKRFGYGRELSDLGIKKSMNQKLVVVRR